MLDGFAPCLAALAALGLATADAPDAPPSFPTDPALRRLLSAASAAESALGRLAQEALAYALRVGEHPADEAFADRTIALSRDLAAAMRAFFGRSGERS